jgi:hypothetical protein
VQKKADVIIQLISFCYIEVYGDGRIMQIHHDQKSISEAIVMLKTTKPNLRCLARQLRVICLRLMILMLQRLRMRRHDDHVHSCGN